MLLNKKFVKTPNMKMQFANPFVFGYAVEMLVFGNEWKPHRNAENANDNADFFVTQRHE